MRQKFCMNFGCFVSCFLRYVIYERKIPEISEGEKCLVEFLAEKIILKALSGFCCDLLAKLEVEIYYHKL